MMYIGKQEDGSHLLVNFDSVFYSIDKMKCSCFYYRSAQYLHRDLPIRFAHRIDDFRNLPFVVACNPLLLELVNSKIFVDL